MPRQCLTESVLWDELRKDGLFQTAVCVLGVVAFLAAFGCDGGGGGGQDCNVPAAPAGSFAIVDTWPCDGETGVSTSTTVGVIFNASADTATLSGYIRPQVDFELQWSQGNRQVALNFAEPLQANTTYTLFVDFGFDTTGRLLANPTRICFSTGSTLGPCFESMSCQAPNATDPCVPAYTAYAYAPFFAANSVWNTPIGANPDIDAGSTTMVNRLAQAATQFSGMWLSFDAHTPPIYFADATTPRHTVTLTATWAPVAQRTNVPIPDHAIPDCGDDNFMVVLDTVNNRFYEFWQVTQQPGGGWSGSWATSLDAAGEGIYSGVYATGDMGVRASQFSLAAGLVWPHELAAGKIEHALVFAYSLVRSGVYTAPAKSTDGASSGTDAIPMGARLQLDPTLSLDGLGLADYEKVIAKALQDYGMILGDSAGGISLNAVHPYSFAGNPYAGLLPDTVVQEDGVLLDKIPAGSFRVLKMNLLAAQ